MWRDRAIAAMLDWEMARPARAAPAISPHAPCLRKPPPPRSAPAEAAGASPDASILASRSPSLARRRAAEAVSLQAVRHPCEGVAMHDSGRSSDPKLAYFRANLDSWIAITRAMLDDLGLVNRPGRPRAGVRKRKNIAAIGGVRMHPVLRSSA